MRVRPEDIAIERHSINKKNSFFLLCGNEDTFIDKINELIINELKTNNYLEVVKIYENVDLQSTLIFNTGSLFSEKKIFVLYNQKLDLDIIKKIDLIDKAIIIIDKKIKNSSKIKKYMRTIEIITGLLLIIFGILILTNRIQELAFFFIKYFPILTQLG